MDQIIPDYLKSTIEDLDRKIRELQLMTSDPELKEMAEEDIKRLETEKETIINSQAERSFTTDSELSTPDSKYDNRNLYLEIRGAAGGEEAKMWGQDLINMYIKYATAQKWKVIQEEPLVIKINGKGAYGKLKYESGVHRVQRVPETESSGRVHTSTATVAVMPELDDIDVNINPTDLDWDFFRGGGHGGQNVNKVSSAVRLTHKPTGIVVTCTEERDQSKNRDKAEKKLRAILWEKEEEKQLSELTAERRAQVGTGMRNEKIRTYNFLQDRITDHRIDKDFHNIGKIMDGYLNDIIGQLQSKFIGSTP